MQSDFHRLKEWWLSNHILAKPTNTSCGIIHELAYENNDIFLNGLM